MNIVRFYALVNVMRKCQKRYEKTRAISAIREAKKYERVVDEELERVMAVIESHSVKQQDLFMQ